MKATTLLRKMCYGKLGTLVLTVNNTETSAIAFNLCINNMSQEPYAA
jgi:hypothetical protein